MHHSQALRQVVAVFFRVIGLMVAMRGTTPLSRRTPRELDISDEHVKQLLSSERQLGTSVWWADLIYKVMEHEPPTLATGGRRDPVARTWAKAVPREVDEYEGVTTIEDYVARIERLTALPQTPLSPATPSPLDLVSALDYLDVVWRVGHEHHLFNYSSAERTAKLAYPANTPEEFDSRLSALGEILRSANANAKAAAGSKLPKATHDDPLAPFEDYLAGKVDSAAEVRIRQAVTELEHALAIRDAAQHVEAGDRAVRALDAFNIGYPIPDFPRAWETLTARVVEGLGAIREELSSTFS
jgi:hypothetical protein